MKHLIIATIFLSIFATSTGTVLAQSASQTQELEQNIEVECTTGAYGQSGTCSVDASQRGRQEQEIILRDGQVVAPHEPVAAGVDLRVVASVGGLLATGITSFIASKKIG